MHNRDMLWDSNSNAKNRRIIKLRNIDDTHLANIINWVTTHSDIYLKEDIDTLKAEANYRNLPKKFLKLAPFKKEDWGKSIKEILSTNNTIKYTSISRLLRGLD